MNTQLFNNKNITQQKIMSNQTHSNSWFSSNQDIIASLWKTFAITRINRGFRQDDIVAMTGVSISTIRRFEAWNTISLESFLRLLRAVWNIGDIDNVLNMNNQSDNFDYDRTRC